MERRAEAGAVWRWAGPLPALGPALRRARDAADHEALAEVWGGAAPPWRVLLEELAPQGLRLPRPTTVEGVAAGLFPDPPSLSPPRALSAAELHAAGRRLGQVLAGLPPEALPPKVLVLGRDAAGTVLAACACPDRWSAPEGLPSAPYMLAAALHAMASGKSPASPPYVFRPLARFLPDVDARWAGLLEACLRADPSARPDLREVLAACPDAARQPAPPAPAEPGATRLLDGAAATVLLPSCFAETEWRGLRERHPLVPGENVLGRAADADVPLPAEDEAASRRHARLVLEAERFILEDLGSRNGTLVNGRRIVGPTELRPGDEVRVGQTLLRVVTEP